MKNNKGFKSFISNLYHSKNLEMLKAKKISKLKFSRSEKLLQAQQEKELLKAKPPAWFDFLSEEARELLIPSIFIQKSTNSN